MPLEVIESTSSLTATVELRVSAIFEMMISLHTVLFSDRHPEWTAEARAALSPDLLEEAKAVYEPYSRGQGFFELALDYPDQEDVPGFIDHVRQMDEATFVFYVVGRTATPEQIEASNYDFAVLNRMLVESDPTGYYHEGFLANLPLADLLADVRGVQRRVTDVWERYWNEFFSGQVDYMRPFWEDALADKQRVLERDGEQALYDLVADGKALPPDFPVDQPYTEIVCVPIYAHSRAVYMIFGYGNVTLLFISQRSEARVAELEQIQKEVVLAFKALGDSTRLKVLRTVASHEGTMHGKLIAAKVGLSPSAVSRHLAQLRDARLIVEVPLDSRVIAYRVQKEAIDSLPEKLLDYLYG